MVIKLLQGVLHDSCDACMCGVHGICIWSVHVNVDSYRRCLYETLDNMAEVDRRLGLLDKNYVYR